MVAHAAPQSVGRLGVWATLVLVAPQLDGQLEERAVRPVGIWVDGRIHGQHGREPIATDGPLRIGPVGLPRHHPIVGARTRAVDVAGREAGSRIPIGVPRLRVAHRVEREILPVGPEVVHLEDKERHADL